MSENEKYTIIGVTITGGLVILWFLFHNHPATFAGAATITTDNTPASSARPLNVSLPSANHYDTGGCGCSKPKQSTGGCCASTRQSPLVANLQDQIATLSPAFVQQVSTYVSTMPVTDPRSAGIDSDA